MWLNAKRNFSYENRDGVVKYQNVNLKVNVKAISKQEIGSQGWRKW